MGKTGGWGGPWVELERPKPPPVEDRYRYWLEAPPELSERCRYWLRQIERGWRPNRHISREGYDSSAQWYGVYIYEYTRVIYPALYALETVPTSSPVGPRPSR